MLCVNKKSGFSVIELLTALVIISIIVGILIPSVVKIRDMAKNTEQKAQLVNIGLALDAFKNDFGDYPESDYTIDVNTSEGYCGAQKLAEALVGRDMRGFHKKSNFSASDNTYYVDFSGLNDADIKANLAQRAGPYLDITKAKIFTIKQIFPNISGSPAVDPDRYVLTDVFKTKTIKIDNTKYVIGTPILYFKANTASVKMSGRPLSNRIYNFENNHDLADLKSVKNNEVHPLANMAGFYRDFGDFIEDPVLTKTMGRSWPNNADSYMLISAGKDGLYGTADDICNFNKNK